MKTIGFGSIKGGTGKSTVCALVARGVAASGKNVCVIDLDPNYSISTAFLSNKIKELDPNGIKNSKNALDGTDDLSNLKDFILPSNYPRIDLLRSTPQLSRLRPPINLLLKKIEMSNLSETYDYIFIDTSATYGDLHILAYNACDVICTPVNPAKFDYQPLKQLGDNISLDTNPNKLSSWRLFFNRCKPNSKFQNEYFDMFRKKFGNIILETQVPDTTKVRYCIDAHYLVGNGEEFSKLRQSILNLAGEITGEEIKTDEAF